MRLQGLQRGLQGIECRVDLHDVVDQTQLASRNLAFSRILRILQLPPTRCSPLACSHSPEARGPRARVMTHAS